MPDFMNLWSVAAARACLLRRGRRLGAPPSPHGPCLRPLGGTTAAPPYRTLCCPGPGPPAMQARGGLPARRTLGIWGRRGLLGRPSFQIGRRRPPAQPPVLRPARPDRPAGCTVRAGAWMSWQTAGAARAQRSPRPAGSRTRCLVDPHANRMLDAAYRCALGGGAAPSPGMLGRAASEAALEEDVRAGPPAGHAAHRLAGGEPARRAGPAGDEDAWMAPHRRVRHRAACRPARPA